MVLLRSGLCHGGSILRPLACHHADAVGFLLVTAHFPGRQSLFIREWCPMIALEYAGEALGRYIPLSTALPGAHS